MFTCLFFIWRVPWNGGRGKRKVAHPLWKAAAACVTASFISEHLITCHTSVSPCVSTLWDGTSTNAGRKLSFTSYWTREKNHFECLRKYAWRFGVCWKAKLPVSNGNSCFWVTLMLARDYSRGKCTFHWYWDTQTPICARTELLLGVHTEEDEQAPSVLLTWGTPEPASETCPALAVSSTWHFTSIQGMAHNWEHLQLGKAVPHATA